MGYAAAATGDDGDPQQAAEIHSQATEDIMSEVNASSVGSAQTAAASDNGGPAAAAAPTPEPDTVPSGPPAGATKNVSFNLLPLSSSGHNDDCDSEEDEGGSGDVTSSVRVAVRIRPFLPSETGTSGVIDVLPANNAAGGHKRRRRQEDQQTAATAAAAVPTSLQIGGPAGVQFTYDAVHGTKSTQADLYLASVRPLVRQCLKGCEFKVSSLVEIPSR